MSNKKSSDDEYVTRNTFFEPGTSGSLDEDEFNLTRAMIRATTFSRRTSSAECRGKRRLRASQIAPNVVAHYDESLGCFSQLKFMRRGTFANRKNFSDSWSGPHCS